MPELSEQNIRNLALVCRLLFNPTELAAMLAEGQNKVVMGQAQMELEAVLAKIQQSAPAQDGNEPNRGQRRRAAKAK